MCDVPEITKVGSETCAVMPNVSFVSDVAELKEHQLDILLVSGSLQYITSPDVLLQKIMGKGLRPAHILLNRLPLYDGHRFVTLQNGGLVYYAQYVFNREEYEYRGREFGLQAHRPLG